MLSAIVLAKNEEKKIAQCLASLSWCNEIIVIDDYSSDQTVKIAKKLKATVYQKRLGNDFSNQRNFGLNLAKGDWILFLDADEKVTSKLKNEILSNISQNQTWPTNPNGFRIKRKTKFLNTLLKHGETSCTNLVRLARKNTGQWQGKVHETWSVKGKICQLKNPIIHYPVHTLEKFISKINSYSSLRSEELYANCVKTNIPQIFAYPTAKFILNYFFRLGFLDGMPGFIIAYLMSLHSFLVRTKLYFLSLPRCDTSHSSGG